MSYIVFHRYLTVSEFIISRIRQVFIGVSQHFCSWLQEDEKNRMRDKLIVSYAAYHAFFLNNCLVFIGVNLLAASELVKFYDKTNGRSMPRTLSLHLPSSTPSVRTDRRAYADVMTKFSRTD